MEEPNTGNLEPYIKFHMISYMCVGIWKELDVINKIMFFCFIWKIYNFYWVKNLCIGGTCLEGFSSDHDWGTGAMKQEKKKKF